MESANSPSALTGNMAPSMPRANRTSPTGGVFFDFSGGKALELLM